MKDLKKNIILFCCLGLFSACSTTVIDKPDTGNAIKFVSTTTRAAIENDFPDGSSFFVWGWYINSEGDRNDVFTETPVTKNDNEWGYEGTQFWIQDNTYNFYAIYYPVGAGTVEQDGTIKVKNFDCSKTGDGAVDLMTAKNIGLSGSSSSTVHLQFKHELSRVNVKVKAENTSVTVNGLKIYGISDVGTLKKDYNDNNYSSSWSLNEAITADNTRFTVSAPFKLNETDGWERNAFGDMLLIPQSLGNAKLYISYRYDGATTDRTSTINLKTATTTGWEAGMSYNYSITINGLSDISITVSVNPWVEENTSVSWE